MNTKRQDNLQRLLQPRNVAFIGGADAAFAAAQCARTFDGPVWGVNPKRQTLGGVPCFPSVADLPEAPDAVFLATPRAAATETVAQLHAIGAGGVACFTAGFGELGENGQLAEQKLVAAAGDMALVGPNCYGLINYTNGAALWPFGVGSERCNKGFALVMQSGMIPANCTMNDRSAPIAYVISAGNQAVLAIEDYMDVLVEDPAVSAIGLYIEGIKDITRFSSAAVKALQAKKPVVVLKAGRSSIAAQLTVSHTGSLSGTDESFQALFDQLGIIRVDAPVAMLETLKFLSISGAPHGNKVAAFTCSGGDAAMVADYCDKVGLNLVQPSQAASKKLGSLLPDIATVSNPLDYTTPLWGNTEVMPKVFGSLVCDGYDAALVVQDFPPNHIHSDNSHYRNDAVSFIKACTKFGIPGAVCSDLPENIDRESREMIIAQGVTPLQGIDSGLDALSRACAYGSLADALRQELEPEGFVPLPSPVQDAPVQMLNEWRGKQLLREAGVSVPAGKLASAEGLLKAAESMGYPVVLKAVTDQLAHKSDVGAVKVGISDTAALVKARDQIIGSVSAVYPDIELTEFLVEPMVQGVLAELLVGIKSDPQFGQVMVVATGGVMVELLQDAVTLLLPTNPRRVKRALESLKSFELLKGFRGSPCCDMNQLITTIIKLSEFAARNSDKLMEMDVNPLMVTATSVVAVDVMIQQKI